MRLNIIRCETTVFVCAYIQSVPIVVFLFCGEQQHSVTHVLWKKKCLVYIDTSVRTSVHYRHNNYGESLIHNVLVLFADNAFYFVRIHSTIFCYYSAMYSIHFERD